MKISDKIKKWEIYTINDSISKKRKEKKRKEKKREKLWFRDVRRVKKGHKNIESEKPKNIGED